MAARQAGRRHTAGQDADEVLAATAGGAVLAVLLHTQASQAKDAGRGSATAAEGGDSGDASDGEQDAEEEAAVSGSDNDGDDDGDDDGDGGDGSLPAAGPLSHEQLAQLLQAFPARHSGGRGSVSVLGVYGAAGLPPDWASRRESGRRRSQQFSVALLYVRHTAVDSVDLLAQVRRGGGAASGAAGAAGLAGRACLPWRRCWAQAIAACFAAVERLAHPDTAAAVHIPPRQGVSEKQVGPLSQALMGAAFNDAGTHYRLQCTPDATWAGQLLQVAHPGCATQLCPELHPPARAAAAAPAPATAAAAASSCSRSRVRAAGSRSRTPREPTADAAAAAAAAAAAGAAASRQLAAPRGNRAQRPGLHLFADAPGSACSTEVAAAAAARSSRPPAPAAALPAAGAGAAERRPGAAACVVVACALALPAHIPAGITQLPEQWLRVQLEHELQAGRTKALHDRLQASSQQLVAATCATQPGRQQQSQQQGAGPSRAATRSAAAAQGASAGAGAGGAAPSFGDAAPLLRVLPAGTSLIAFDMHDWALVSVHAASRPHWHWRVCCARCAAVLPCSHPGCCDAHIQPLTRCTRAVGPLPCGSCGGRHSATCCPLARSALMPRRLCAGAAAMRGSCPCGRPRCACPACLAATTTSAPAAPCCSRCEHSARARPACMCLQAAVQ
jgi:hypothetical protein